MKQRFYLAFLIFTFGMLTACDDPDEKVDPKPEPTEAEIQIQKIVAKRWTATLVSRDDKDLTDDFSNFTITFSGALNEAKDNVKDGTFTTENSLAIFSKDGPWMFQADNVSSQLLLANRLTNYELSNNDNQLTLTFLYVSQNNARKQSVSGEYIFQLEIAQ